MARDKIHFFNEQTNYRIGNKNLIRKWLEDVISNENFRVGELNIILCNDAYLYEMNVEYLKHDTFTDIITFDYTESNVVSGDLFISISRIRENAVDFAIRIREELHRVIVHGVLHLCTYGDKTKEEKNKMTSKENFYLARRPLKLKHT
jgi:rRNA maturation RNase YbeY